MTEKLMTVATDDGDHYDKVLMESVTYYTQSVREMFTNIGDLQMSMPS